MKLPCESGLVPCSVRFPSPAQQRRQGSRSAGNLRSIPRMTRLTALVVLALATAVLLKPVTASAASRAVITGVTFSGNVNPPGPTVTVTGNNFGLHPPTGYNNNSTSCGPYTNNGDDFGTKFIFTDHTSSWEAGRGIPPNGDCIGISVSSWSPTQVVFMFGNAYGSFDDWFAHAGDSFTLKLKRAVFNGTISYT